MSGWSEQDQNDAERQRQEHEQQQWEAYWKDKHPWWWHENQDNNWIEEQTSGYDQVQSK